MNDYGAYGSSLNYFPEILTTFVYGTMVPQINDGYGAWGTDAFTTIGTYQGVIINHAGRATDENGNLVITDEWILRCYQTLITGNFIEYNGERFRIVKQTAIGQYMGFSVYILEKIVGSDGSVTTSSGFNIPGGDIL